MHMQLSDKPHGISLKSYFSNLLMDIIQPLIFHPVDFTGGAGVFDQNEKESHARTCIGLPYVAKGSQYPSKLKSETSRSYVERNDHSLLR